ncbi:PhoH family protein [Pantoea phage Phynn]|nr:PhoH family protein [Pantoea phage Phynn]
MKYVVDTNVLVSNPYSIYSFNEPGTEIIITSATMEELDHLKRKQEISREVRLAIRVLSGIIMGRTYKEISETGIPLNQSNPAIPESVTLRVVDYHGNEPFALDNQDARIIATCKQQKAVLITRDINMMLIAMSSGCEVKPFTGDDNIKDSDVLYAGYLEAPCFWENLTEVDYDADKNAVLSYQDFEGKELYPNQYIVDNGELVGKVVAVEETYFTVKPIKHSGAMKRSLLKSISPRDALQASFIDAAFDPDSDIVSVMGGAGSGKTILAVGAAMELIGKNRFANLLYVKSDSPLSGEVGFLPGTLNDKLRPAIEPCFTSLNILFKDEADPEAHIEKLMETGVIKFPSLHYFRGMSIGHPDPGKGSVLIVDEAQNLSNHEIRSIISRMGENSLLILCGNIKQIDNPRNTAINNGFVYAVEKLKEYEHSSHIILNTVYRGRLAAFVEDNF